jgi:hypothetical protein
LLLRVLNSKSLHEKICGVAHFWNLEF